MPPSLIVKGSIISSDPKFKDIVALDYIVDIVKSKLVEFGAQPASSINDKVFIIRARTGSGKSTAMPVALYRIFNPSGISGSYIGGNILCTQPRVLTAIDIPTELANHEENPWSSDMVLGKTIGFSTGSGKEPCRNCLIYATLDTLLMNLIIKSDIELMELYRIIILDEVHERSITFDLVTRLLKIFLNKNLDNPKCPIIIFTSATFDVDKYAEYLNVDKKTNIIDIKGQTFPVKDHYLDEDTDNYISKASEIVNKIHNNTNSDKGDILVFLPGMGEMRKFKKDVLKYMKKDNGFMFSILSRETVGSGNAFRDLKLNVDELSINNEGEYDRKSKIIATRRIFMGTTVAETGITISTLRYVIDSGFTNMSEWYFPYGILGLNIKPEAKSRATQRRGRVGRKFEGDCYFLMTEKTYSELLVVQHPDIISQNIDKIFLSLVNDEGILDLSDIDMLDNPPIDSLKYALTKNNYYGFFDNETCTLTEYGKQLKSTQYLTVEGFRMILSAYQYDVAITDIITIIAMINWRPPLQNFKIFKVLKVSIPNFILEMDSDDKSFLAIFKEITNDDMILELFYFHAFTIMSSNSLPELDKWCKEVGLGLHSMISLIEERTQIMNDLIKIGYNPLLNSHNSITKTNKKNYLDVLSNIKQVMYDGLQLNLLTYDEKSESYKDRYNNVINIKYNNSPKYIISDKIMIRSDMNTYKKELSVRRISVLDGYIGIR